MEAPQPHELLVQVQVLISLGPLVQRLYNYPSSSKHQFNSDKGCFKQARQKMLLRAPAASSGQAIAASRKRLPNEAATRSGDTERVEKKIIVAATPPRANLPSPQGAAAKGSLKGLQAKQKLEKKKQQPATNKNCPLQTKQLQPAGSTSWLRMPEGCRKAAGRLLFCGQRHMLPLQHQGRNSFHW